MPENPDLTNRTLGAYRCVCRVTAGGFGTVWKAVSRDGSETVAIKIINADLAESRQAQSVFQKEYTMCRNFDHPGLLRYLDFQRFEGIPYMVMEYFDSCTLKTAMSDAAPFPAKGLAHTIIRNAGDAIAYIHEQGVIHCDIKPENILVNAEGVVRLIDFSIAMKAGAVSTWLPFLRKVEGTPSYMPPEQILKKKLTPDADTYAFGATIYEFLGGRPPFVGKNQNEVMNKALKTPPTPLAKLNPGITPGLDKAVLSMLAKDPNDRPHDIRAFLRQLDRAGVYRAL